MTNLMVALHSQQGIDERGRLSSHQWAEVPDELAVIYMTGGLKRVRRMAEAYTRCDYAPDLMRRVRAVWRRGEPQFLLRRLRMSLLRLGRLRQAGTVDAYRGHFEILGGAIVPREAITSPLGWPEDLPWAAPSAGEFDIEAEQQRPPYLGVFELRVYRRPSGCNVHVFVRDLPLARRGLKGWLVARPWLPLTSAPNIAFLRADVQGVARELDHAVQFEERTHDGIPEPLPPLRPLQETFSALRPS